MPKLDSQNELQITMINTDIGQRTFIERCADCMQATEGLPCSSEQKCQKYHVSNISFSRVNGRGKGRYG